MLILLFAVLSTSGAMAQFRLGPIVGVNYNRQTQKSNTYRYENLFQNRLAFNVGVIGDLVITPWLSIQPELLYTFKGGAYQLEQPNLSEEYKANLGYVQLPISLTGKLVVGKAAIFGSVGGYVSKLVFTNHSYTLNDDINETGKLRVGTDYFTDQIKPWDAGARFKFGVELNRGFYLAAFYDVGAYDINPQFTVTRNKTVGVQTGYIFSLSEEDRYDRFENFYEF